MSEIVEISIEIPVSLFEWLNARARQAGLPSAADYAKMLLVETASVVQKVSEDAEQGTTTDEELIEERLRALGYIE